MKIKIAKKDCVDALYSQKGGQEPLYNENPPPGKDKYNQTFRITILV